jgi:hypothetical protein
MRKSFFDKYLKFQKEVEAITKDSKNPHFKNRYFDINSLLEEVKPKLTSAGLGLTQRVVNDNGRQLLCSEIFDDEGVGICSSIALPEISDPQKMGSAITYYRRYSLQALLALQGEDDDAEKCYDRQPAPSAPSGGSSGSGFRKSTFGGGSK